MKYLFNKGQVGRAAERQWLSGSYTISDSLKEFTAETNRGRSFHFLLGGQKAGSVTTVLYNEKI